MYDYETWRFAGEIGEPVACPWNQPTASPANFLDLAHGGTSCADAAGPHVCRSSRSETRDDGGCDEGREAEEEEGGRGLRLGAALVAVVAAVRDAVALRVVLFSNHQHSRSLCTASDPVCATHAVAAAMHAQLGRQRDRTAEPEDGVEHVERDGEDGVDGEGVADPGGDQVEEREHGEDGAEHDVVDDGGVAGVGVGNHIAGEGHNEEGHEELWGVRMGGIGVVGGDKRTCSPRMARLMTDMVAGF